MALPMRSYPYPYPNRSCFLSPVGGRILAVHLSDVFSRFRLRDPETAAHCLRVAATVRLISSELGLAPTPSATFSMAALFHDIGKTAVSDRIIQKEGMLTGEEFEAVKRHTEKTREILDRIDWPEPLSRVPGIAACHHERWDGSGYPLGLAGEQIPLGARVTAVADYFDALTSRRRYREPLSRKAACLRLEHRRGTLFDPTVTDAFLRRFSKPIRQRPWAVFHSHDDPAPAGAPFTRTGIFAEPPRSAEDPRQCRGIESPRCR
jgi:putative nucleotidyltransferase with HDIG domain